MDDIVLRIRDLIENETRSCSMDTLLVHGS